MEFVSWVLILHGRPDVGMTRHLHQGCQVSGFFQRVGAESVTGGIQYHIVTQLSPAACIQELLFNRLDVAGS
jgi:hypothetical protein